MTSCRCVGRWAATSTAPTFLLEPVIGRMSCDSITMWFINRFTEPAACDVTARSLDTIIRLSRCISHLTKMKCFAYVSLMLREPLIPPCGYLFFLFKCPVAINQFLNLFSVPFIPFLASVLFNRCSALFASVWHATTWGKVLWDYYELKHTTTQNCKAFLRIGLLLSIIILITNIILMCTHAAAEVFQLFNDIMRLYCTRLWQLWDATHSSRGTFGPIAWKSWRTEGLLMLNKKTDKRLNPVMTFSWGALPFKESQFNKHPQKVSVFRRALMMSYEQRRIGNTLAAFICT